MLNVSFCKSRRTPEGWWQIKWNAVLSIILDILLTKLKGLQINAPPSSSHFFLFISSHIENKLSLVLKCSEPRLLSDTLQPRRGAKRLKVDQSSGVEDVKGIIIGSVWSCWSKMMKGGLSVHVCVWRTGVDTDTTAPLSSSVCSQDVWGTPHRSTPSNLCWNQKPCGSTGL